MNPFEGTRTASVLNSLQPTQAQPQAPQPGFWQRILPTAGGILGGIGGTLLGGPLGGAAGAAVGGGLGKGIENATEGQNPIEMNDVTSGISNGLGQLIGGGIGSVGGALLGKLGGTAEAGAAKLLAGQAPGLIDKNLATDLLGKYGITDLKQGATIASKLTGSSDSAEGRALINKAVENGINANGPKFVDVSNIGSNFDKSFNPINTTNLSLAQSAVARTHGLDPNDAKKLLTFVDSEVSKVPQNMEGGTDPLSALQMSRSLADKGRQLAVQATTAGASKGNLLAASKAYNELAADINDKIFAPGGQSILIPDGEKEALTKNILSSVGPVNPKAATAIANDVQGANSYQDLRAIQAKWVGVNQAVQKTENIASQNFGTTARDMARAGLPIAGAAAAGPHGLVAGVAANALSKSPALDSAGSSVLSKLADVFTSPIAKSAAKYGGGVTGVTAANLPNDIPTPNQLTGGVTQNAMNPQGNNLNAVSFGNQLDAMLAADPMLASSLGPVLQALIPQIQKTNAAQSALQQYEQTLGAAGGAQGPASGLLSLLGGTMTGGPASLLGGQQHGLQAALGGATGLPANSFALPGLMQNQAGATAGLNLPTSVLSSLL